MIRNDRDQAADGGEDLVVVVDYGAGNVRSVRDKVDALGTPVVVSGEPEDVRGAGKLILPGVGHFRHAMENLAEHGLIRPIREQVEDHGIPILGICLGMQLFTDYGEEGDVDGFGWIRGRSSRIEPPESAGPYPVPHIGWNTLELESESPLLWGIDEDDFFYFAHSYAVVPEDEESVVAYTSYGVRFASVVQLDHVFGTQFHPEKSHGTGMRLLENFVGA